MTNGGILAVGRKRKARQGVRVGVWRLGITGTYRPRQDILGKVVLAIHDGQRNDVVYELSSQLLESR